MELFSKDFVNGGQIPKEFGCDEAGYSPELHWIGAPANAKSFALVASDPDAPVGTFYHWLACNIPATVSSIPRDSVPAGAKQLPNDAHRQDYVAPCPPSGTHRYYFRLFALDAEKLDCKNRQELFAEIEKHKIAAAELMGTFKRN